MNILKSAELHNFRGYWDKNNTIEFRPGINLILGDNATGKSSIVTLVMFNLLHKKIDVGRYEDYRTIEPKDLGAYKAGLSLFGVDGKEYSIYKFFDGRAVRVNIRRDGVELKKVGELELSRLGEAQRFILDRFGVTEDILEYLLVQLQDPAKLLWPVKEPREVGAILSRLLRFEPLQNIFTNAKSCHRILVEKTEEFESELKDIETQIEELRLAPPKTYERKIHSLETREEKWRKLSEKLTTQISESKAIKEEKEAILTTLRQKQGGAKQLSQQIERVRVELRGVKKPRQTLGQINKRRQEINTQLQKLTTSFGDILKRTGSFSRMKTKAGQECKSLTREIAALSQSYASLVDALKEKGIDVEPKGVTEISQLRRGQQKELTQLSETIGGLKEKEKAESEYIEILSQAKANCPVCDSRLTPKQRQKILREKKELISKIKKDIREKRKAEKDASDITQMLEQVVGLLKDLSDRSGKLARYQKEEKMAEKKLALLSKLQAKIKSRQDKLKERDNSLEKIAKVAEKFGELKEWSEALKATKKELLALPKTEKEISRRKKEIEKLGQKQQRIEKNISAIEPQINALKDTLKNAKVWYEKLTLAKKKVKVAQGFAEEIGLASDAAKAALYELFTGYSDMVNYSLRWIWPVLYPRSDLRQIELEVNIEEVEERGEKTLIAETRLTRLAAEGQRIPFNTISSHGQRVLASIAFRVAFVNLLWKTTVPRILVLDEPTIWIDNQNRERLGQLLSNLVKEVKEGGIKLEQVIVISHDPAFLNAIDPEGVKHVCVKNEYGFCEVRSAVED